MTSSRLKTIRFLDIFNKLHNTKETPANQLKIFTDYLHLVGLIKIKKKTVIINILFTANTTKCLTANQLYLFQKMLEKA